MQASNGCYCGGKLAKVIDGLAPKTLRACVDCRRLYVGKVLLVPWKGFRERGSNQCPRCGGETNYNTRTLRFKCEDPLCAYGWREKTDRNSMVEHRMKEEMRELRQKMGDSTNPMEFAPKYAELKAELVKLKEDEL